MEKILTKAKLIVNFKENSKNINEEHNKKNFHEINFVKIKKNIYYIYRKNVLSINK